MELKGIKSYLKPWEIIVILILIIFIWLVAQMGSKDTIMTVIYGLMG